MKAEKLIKDKVVEFVNDQFDNFDHEKLDITQTKEQFLRMVKKDVQFALWVFLEVAWWGMKDKKEYLRELIINDKDVDDYIIIKIKNKYIKLDFEYGNNDYIITFVKPKYKKIIYFE